MKLGWRGWFAVADDRKENPRIARVVVETGEKNS
jgi:hypothetical protein